jgi:hypothetical protein
MLEPESFGAHTLLVHRQELEGGDVDIGAFEDDGAPEAAGESHDDPALAGVESCSDLEDVDEVAPEGFQSGHQLSEDLQQTVGRASNNGPEEQLAAWSQRVSSLAAACQEAATRSRPTTKGLSLLLFRSTLPEGSSSVCQQGRCTCCGFDQRAAHRRFRARLPGLGRTWIRRAQPAGHLTLVQRRAQPVWPLRLQILGL